MDIFGSSNGKQGAYRPVANNEFSDDSDDEDDFVKQSMRKQKLQMARQDQGLEMLAQSAQRLGEMSNTITEELEYQNNMLDDMEEDLETATDNLDMVTRRTKDMIKKAGGKQNFLIILSLVGVVVLLVMLILYT